MKKQGIGRRDFIKVAGASTAGVTIATTFNPLSYAANEKVRIGCIGTGGQGTFHLQEGLAGVDAIEVAAIADPLLMHQKQGVTYGLISNAKIRLITNPATGKMEMRAPKDMTDDEKNRARAAFRPVGYYDYREMLAKEQIDAVVVSTPLNTHHQITLDCLAAGKWVFCEKTMTQTIEQARDIVIKCHETGKFVQVGHQRRYNPKYNLAMWMVYEKNMLGRLTHITSGWHRNNWWRRDPLVGYTLNDQEKALIPDIELHWNWRMYNALSGGLFTELMTHQSDIANWFMRAVPTRVYAVAGLDYWKDGRETGDNIMALFDYVQKPNMPGFRTVARRNTMQDITKINTRPYTVRMEYSSILMNGRRSAIEMIHGDEGTLSLTEIEKDCIYYAEPEAEQDRKALEKAMQAPTAEAAPETAAKGAETRLRRERAAKGEGILTTKILDASDVYQFEAFVHHIRNGGVPRTNQVVGLTTAITSISALKSAETGAPVEIDPAWYTFDFEVPSFHEYEWKGDEAYADDPVAVAKKKEEDEAAKAAEEAAAPAADAAPAPAPAPAAEAAPAAAPGA